MQILNGIFIQNACFFLHLVEGNGKKLRKISLSSKTSQGEDTWTATIGHRELIICPIDSNGDSLVFDSLFCISEYMQGITLCLKFTAKIWIRGFKSEKTYLHLLIFQPADVDYWFPIFWKNPSQACFEITDFIFGPK